MASDKDKDFVPGSAGWPNQPPAAEGVGERRPGSGRDFGGDQAGGRVRSTGQEGVQQPDQPEGDPEAGDVGVGTRDPAGSGARWEPDTPVRPGGGGQVYEYGEDELPRSHERDVQARGDFEAVGPGEPGSGRHGSPASGSGRKDQ